MFIFDLHYRRPIKLIKVSEELLNDIKAQCQPDILDNIPEYANGVIGDFTGIPIVVDPTLSSNEYKIVFAKEE